FGPNELTRQVPDNRGCFLVDHKKGESFEDAVVPASVYEKGESSSASFLKNKEERVKRDLYFARVRAYDFYREMVRRGFLLNHLFEIDLMSVKLGTFDVIIGMDWIVKQDAIIIYGEKIVHIRYGNKTLIVKSDKEFYEVELADGRVVSTNIVLNGCTLNLVNHVFEFDLLPIELGTFDVIIGIDWLVKHDLVIVCGERVVHIPYGNKMLIVESDKGVSRLKVISCIKAHVPMIRDFPEDLPGLPPPRQVEFEIDLVLGATPVARAPYRLAPSEMKELSVQLGVYVDPAKVEAIKSWAAPTTPTEKNKKYEWGKEEEEAFQTLMQNMCSAPILALPEGTKDFVVYCDASLKEKRAFYMERSKDEDTVIFMVVVVSTAGDGDEEEKMSSKKMRTNGLLIEEVVGEAFNIKEEANIMEVQDEDELTLLMARHDEQEERIKPWHIDFAASNHMTGKEHLFAEMEQSKGNVTFGDESKAPVKGKDNKTPQEAWNGLKPTVSHLRVFGSIAYGHVPSQRRLKLDDRSEKHVYDFLPMTDEEETDESSEEAQQSQSPTPTQDSPSSSSKGEPKIRSLKKCRQAIDGEIRPIERKDTWKLMTLPKGQKAIGVKWVYKANKKPQRRSGEVQGKNCGKIWKIHQMDEKSKINLAKNLAYHHR
nr:putative reverse transcriptase domain-containing protein [Tanacetum cinerariifolium]